MSRIGRFEGSMDGAEPGAEVIFGFVFGSTPNLPEFGFVSIPLKTFSRADQAVLRESKSVKIEGRACPRSLRCRVVSATPRKDD